jgi:AcrR family transcriptional regulator
MSKKKSIIEGATRLFAEKGIKETSIAEISKLTGAAEGTIYHHFKTKDELFLAILENVKTGILEDFESYSAEKSYKNGLEKVENIILFYLYLAGKQENWFYLLHRHYPYELAAENDTCRKLLEEIYNCLVEIFESAILAGMEDGSIGDVTPRKTALIIFSMVNGLIWFKIHNLYDAGSLYMELISSCRRMLKKY